MLGEFRPGQVVLADIESGRESVRVVELWPQSAWSPTDRLYVEALDQSARAVIDVALVQGPCSGFVSCRTEGGECVHCGEQHDDPHAMGCPHLAHEFFADECDVRLDSEDALREAYDVQVEVRSVDGRAAGRAVLTTLQRHGFELVRPVAGVWRKEAHGPATFVGAVGLVDAEVVERA